MLISTFINDGIDLISRQLKFYCWHYKRDLDQRQQQELVDILNEHYFERLADKIKSLVQSNITDAKQQIGRLLFEQCLIMERRHQLIQLIESELLDIDVRLDSYGRTLLHRTAYNLDVELVKILIDNGVNIRLRDCVGNTALHLAIQSYRNGAAFYSNEPSVMENLTQVVQLLLDADKRLQMMDKSFDESSSPLGEDCFKSQAHLLEGDVLKDRPNSSKQPHPDNNQSSAKLLLNDSDIANNRDVTICRMLGSQCTCNPSHNSARPVDMQASATTTTKISDPTIHEPNMASDCTLLENISVPLVDVKNVFGRTALHYCVQVVGEQHFDQAVELLLSYGADPDLVDVKLKSPLYCLVKRPGVAAVRQKCRAIGHLIKSGCDDLGLAIEPDTYFTENLMKNLESNISTVLQKHTDESVDQIFVQKSFKRVPTLKHLARLKLIKINDDLNGGSRLQKGFKLPDYAPNPLNIYVNRKILDQSELF